MKIKVDETGLNGREVNPYEEKLPNGLIPIAYKEFEATNRTYPLTEKQEPGSVVECGLVWQINYDWLWHPVSDEWYANMKIATSNEFRQAYQPITQPEKVEETVEELAETFYHSFDDVKLDQGPTVQECFIAGWKANNEHQHSLTKVKP